jgi:hypothetical protein
MTLIPTQHNGEAAVCRAPDVGSRYSAQSHIENDSAHDSRDLET